MVRADLFCTVDKMCRIAKPEFAHRPFGGIQIVAVGDFAQIPPVVKRYSDYLQLTAEYGGIYAFDTPTWEATFGDNIVLNKVHRQADDNDYLEILNSIRQGIKFSDVPKLQAKINQLNNSVTIGETSDESPVICTRKLRADNINSAKRSRLPGCDYTFSATVSGIYEEDEFPTDIHLHLCIGSRVMIVKNLYAQDDEEPMCVNGDLGVVTDLAPGVATVELDKGIALNVVPDIWISYSYIPQADPKTGEKVLQEHQSGWFKQLPLKLADAFTVHKAQGLTFSRVHLDLNWGTFASGHLYTALSRCSSLQGLSLDREVALSDVKLDPHVRDFEKQVESRAARRLTELNHYVV